MPKPNKNNYGTQKPEKQDGVVKMNYVYESYNTVPEFQSKKHNESSYIKQGKNRYEVQV